MPPTNFARGARPTPRHRLARAMPHVARAVPSPFGVIPTKLDMWLNDQYGDCVTAEEAFSKAAWSVGPNWGNRPVETFIPPDNVKAWASKHDVLNGAVIEDVLNWMKTDGLTADDNLVYTDGAHQSVDWTNYAAIQSAIYQGPVKIGVAADQLGSSGAGGAQGWFGLGWHKDTSLDHCVALTGYGTLQDLAGMMHVNLPSLPSGLTPSSPAVLLFTWGTIGIVDFASMVNITGEAWVRLPTTSQQLPNPTPTPTPTPTPIPPVPTPIPATACWWDVPSKTLSLAPGWKGYPQPLNPNLVTSHNPQHRVAYPPGWTITPASAQDVMTAEDEQFTAPPFPAAEGEVPKA